MLGRRTIEVVGRVVKARLGCREHPEFEAGSWPFLGDLHLSMQQKMAT